MYSHEHPIDKARRLQEERIKANQNCFITWDHWVPPKFWPIPSPQKDGIVVGHNTAHTRPNIISTSWARQLKKDIASTMPSGEDRKYFGNEVFDMCWNTKADQEPMVETLTAKHLAEPHYGGQMFDMCWNTEADQVLAVETPVAATQSTEPHFRGQIPDIGQRSSHRGNGRVIVTMVLLIH
ncbi:hypothetical protein BD769DRAFT_1381903 [Suillus cothurnatus]|nr:hypothetical protein BD769DRAFT_1381903 [Suillus cothurnatus]